MRFIDELDGLVSSQLNVIKTFLSLTKLEAKLAGLSIFPLLVSLCLLSVILTGTWLTAMCLFYYGMVQLFDNVVIGLASVFLFNLLSLGILLNYLLFNLKKMSFEKTRAYLSARGKEVEPDEFKKADHDSNSNSKQRAVESTEPAQ